jgi:hypothetical protein
MAKTLIKALRFDEDRIDIACTIFVQLLKNTSHNAKEATNVHDNKFYLSSALRRNNTEALKLAYIYLTLRKVYQVQNAKGII